MGFTFYWPNRNLIMFIYVQFSVGNKGVLFHESLMNVNRSNQCTLYNLYKACFTGMYKDFEKILGFYQ